MHFDRDFFLKACALIIKTERPSCQKLFNYSGTMPSRKGKRAAHARYENRTSKGSRDLVLVEFEKDLIAWQRAQDDMLKNRIADFDKALKTCGPKPKAKQGNTYCNKRTKKWTPAAEPRPTRPRAKKHSRKSS